MRCFHLFLASGLLTACADPAAPTRRPFADDPPPGTFTDHTDGDDHFDPSQQYCDPTRSVRSDGPALLISDPAVLSRFTLERVLGHLAAKTTSYFPPSPTEMLQRLFDTENSSATAVFPDVVHCDDRDSQAFANASATACPRNVGALASSEGLLVPGHPDYFAPVAVVNRFDLMPNTLATCGEYRIVYSKLSGRTDPEDRVSLIFEASLPNSTNDVFGCWPVADAWASLEDESDPTVMADRLDELFFDGLPGFDSIVSPLNFGQLSVDDTYATSRGQVRSSGGIHEPFALKELRLLMADDPTAPSPLLFEPSTVKNNPLRDLFDPAVQTDLAEDFRAQFSGLVSDLATPDVAGIRMLVPNAFNAGESTLAGAAACDYATMLRKDEQKGSSGLVDAVTTVIDDANLEAGCGADPMTATDILNRATVQTCAGCHAPQLFLDADRDLG
jgi:hypothetical protein